MMLSPIMRNFVQMTVAFSVNHGCVLAVLNVAVILLGKNGSYQSGSLYVTYAVTALVLSPGLLDLLGARKALIWAAALYSIYVISFPVALIIPSSMPELEVVVALLGGVIGGFAAGFLWSAQGTYFALNAKDYARRNSISLSEANATFASLFAAIFLGLEVALKLLPVAMTPLSHTKLSVWGGKEINARDLIIASLYSVLAIVSVFGLVGISDLTDEQAEEEEAAAATQSSATALTDEDKTTALLATPAKPFLRFEKAGAAVTLWFKQPVVLLLAPIQITFGVCASLLAYQMAGKVVKSQFGSDSVVVGSLLSAMVAAVAASLQLPFKHIAAKIGKPPLMITCICAFVALSSLVLSFPLPDASSPPLPPSSSSLMMGSNSTSPPAAAPLKRGVDLGNWGLLLTCYVLQGIGRACYEGTNKALYADFFPNDATGAFSNIVLANGISSAVSYFVFPSLDKNAISLIALVCSTLTVISYSLAELYHHTYLVRVSSSQHQ